MPIEFRCTQCGKLLRTADTTAGKLANCPACGAVVVIPEAGSVPLPPLPTPPLQPLGEAWSPPQNAASEPEPQSWQTETNPYQPPAAGGMTPTTGEPSATALSRVAGPAIALMVTGGLGIAFQLLGLLGNILQVAIMPQQGGQANEAIPVMLTGGLGIVLGLFNIVIGGVIVYGAMQMKDLRSYSLAMSSAILAMIPCLSPCCLLGLPFGIWAIVAISSPEVRSAFRG